jgi:act minimal PKS ketosynthase (KS/KS alpha)
MRRRVVITGVGVIAPDGIGLKPFWDLLTAGQTATRRISFFDPSPFRSQVAAECDFDPLRESLSPQQVRRMDRAAQFAVVSARASLEDSGISVPDLNPARTGVSIGSAVGCTMGLEEEYTVVSDGGRHWLVNNDYTVPHLFGYFVPSSIAVEVAWEAAAEGPVSMISTGCTSGIDAVGHAAALIGEEAADVMLVGATITMACFDAIKATTSRNAEPERASRPFDRTRDGFVLGEGAAVFVLEELEHARRRGAQVYAEIAGFATRCNAYHMTGLRPDGLEMAEAIGAALAQARKAPEEVDYVNAHGSGTKQNDRHETAALKRSLGQHAFMTPVSSIKSMIGHSLGAIGSLEIAACALAMKTGIIPPTANLHEPDPECDLDYVPIRAREALVDTVLTVGSGFGGFQSAMVLTTPDKAGR